MPPKPEKQRVAPTPQPPTLPASFQTEIYLTEEERKSVEIIDANENYVVIYRKSKGKKPRKNKKKRSSRTQSKVDGSIPRTSSTPNLLERNEDKEESSNASAALTNTNRSSSTTTTMSAPNPTPSTSQTPISVSTRFGHYMRSLYRNFFVKYRAIKLLQFFLAFYICLMTFLGGLRDPETGLIVDPESEDRTDRGLILVNGTERPIIATTTFQVACIGVARLSAWFMYPTLALVYISKLRATNSFLAHTPLAMFMYGDQHELHVYCGWNILVFSTLHSVGHLARWMQQNTLQSLLFGHRSGITGFLIMMSCILICLPMTFLKDKIRYEVRKNMHYLFLLFAFALCFHTPTSAIPNGGFTAWVFGIILVWYFLDAVYCNFFMTEKIDTSHFYVLPSGVRMSMNVSKRFQKMGAQGGYCYVCLPWVDKNQWHAFSLFENPSNPAERQIFMMKLGDWTSNVHRILQRDTVRPVWVQGPFPSPYNSAEQYDNQILVASGIGITPALSVIRAHKDVRRINLIWAVRDKYLLEFFLRHLYLDHHGWNLIFYTGKERLDASEMELFTNTNICIIEGRPSLKDVIPNIIYGIESGLGLPERYKPETKEIASQLLVDRLSAEFHQSNPNNSRRKSFVEHAEDLACYASELGFHLPANVVSEEMNRSAEFCFVDEEDEEAVGVGVGVGPGHLDRLVSGIASNADNSKSNRRLSAAMARTKSIRQNLSIGFRPWEHHEGADAYVKSLDPNLIIPTWGILYCGGAKRLEADLTKISDEYQLQIHIESFAW